MLRFQSVPVSATYMGTGCLGWAGPGLALAGGGGGGGGGSGGLPPGWVGPCASTKHQGEGSMHAESFTFHIRDVVAKDYSQLCLYGANLVRVLVQVYAASLALPVPYSSLARPATTAQQLADFATRAGGWRGACGRYAEVTAATIVSYYRIICRQFDLNELRTNVELNFRSTSLCTLQFHLVSLLRCERRCVRDSMYSTCNSS